MKDWKNVLFTLIVAVLLFFFVLTAVEAFYPSPEYNDYCDYRSYKPYDNMTEEEQQQQYLKDIECQESYTEASRVHGFAYFAISSILGIIIVIVGLYLPANSEMKIILGNAFLFAGLIIVFFGTVRGWQSIATQLRPFILLIELIIVIVVAWKKIGSKQISSSGKKAKSNK